MQGVFVQCSQHPPRYCGLHLFLYYQQNHSSRYHMLGYLPPHEAGIFRTQLDTPTSHVQLTRASQAGLYLSIYFEAVPYWGKQMASVDIFPLGR